MKFAYIFLTVLGFSTAVPTTRDLQENFDDILNVLPIAKIINIFYSHLNNDPALNAVIVYLQSDSLHELVADFETNPTWQFFEAYLDQYGVPIDELVKVTHQFIGSIKPGPADDKASLKSFLNDIGAVLPVDKLGAIIGDKLQNNPDFILFYEKISSDIARKVVEELRGLDEVIYIQTALEEMEVDVQGFWKGIYGFLKWD